MGKETINVDTTSWRNEADSLERLSQWWLDYELKVKKLNEPLHFNLMGVEEWKPGLDLTKFNHYGEEKIMYGNPSTVMCTVRFLRAKADAWDNAEYANGNTGLIRLENRRLRIRYWHRQWECE